MRIQTRPTDSEDLMDILRLRQVEMDFLSIMSPILDFASVGRIAQPLTIQVQKCDTVGELTRRFYSWCLFA